MNVAHDTLGVELLEEQRERAERLLNRFRIAVLVLLSGAALVYAPTLSNALNVANALVLVPTLVWALAQQWWLHGHERLPGWLAVANPIVDTTAVTAIIAGYGIAQSEVLALKSPVFLTYFLVLAARPIASSVRKTSLVALLVVAEYGALLVLFSSLGRLSLLTSPLAASMGPGVSVLDEAAKILFLGVAGSVATYATAWHERIVLSYLRETRERARAQGQLAEARLHSLQLQLQPHFLFNTLNAITALVHTEPRGAERMIAGLSELLRASLRSVQEQEVPLARELEHLRLYLDIQQTRFGDRLQVEMDIDPAAKSALVPSLVLQPLVENAIRHGLAPRASGGHIRVAAACEEEQLVLEVSDDGVGAEAPAGILTREGVGISNTRERLRQLHGDRQRFAYETGSGRGFAVRIALPYRTEAAPA